MRRTILQVIVAFALVFSLAGCAGSDIPDAKPTSGRNPQVAEVPDSKETVRGDNDPPIVTLDLGNALHERAMTESDALPGNIIIPTTNLNAVPITAALQAVLSGTDVSLSWDTGTLGSRLVTVMNLSGPLPSVVDKICSAAKVFCTYRNGSLELHDKDTFIISLPPIAKALSGSSGGGAGGGSGNSIVDTINQLTGGKAEVDDQGGNIIYTSDVEGESRVRQYLEQLRNGRPLIVMQLYIWEVTLNKENSEGINWNELNIGDIGPGFAKLALSSASNFSGVADAGSLAADSITSGGVSLGAVTTGRLNTNSLMTFLATQGRLQTISSPQVTFISGSSAALTVGGTQRYISQVGTQTSNVSGTTASSAATNTISTDSIDTGLTVTVTGAYENNVVFANLDIALRNLVSLGSTTASPGQIIDLPTTTDEKMNTNIRVRPGDNLVMAGLVTSADTNSEQGLPIGDDGRLPTYGDDTYQNHELVIVVKPSVVLFSDKKEVAEAKKEENAKPLPDAVVIDKNGSTTFAMPNPQNAPSAPPPNAMMVATPPTTPVQNVTIAPDDDGAPVDRRLLQRGFSHAFDDLLQPAPTPPSAGTLEDSGAQP